MCKIFQQRRPLQERPWAVALGQTQPSYSASNCSSAQSLLSPPIYSETCLVLLPHRCLRVRAGQVSTVALRSLSSPPTCSVAPQQKSKLLSLQGYHCTTPLSTDGSPAFADHSQEQMLPVRTSAVQRDIQPSMSCVSSNGWTFELKVRIWSPLEFRYNLIGLNTAPKWTLPKCVLVPTLPADNSRVVPP